MHMHSAAYYYNILLYYFILTSRFFPVFLTFLFLLNIMASNMCQTNINPKHACVGLTLVQIALAERSTTGRSQDKPIVIVVSGETAVFLWHADASVGNIDQIAAGASPWVQSIPACSALYSRHPSRIFYRIPDFRSTVSFYILVDFSIAINDYTNFRKI